MSNANLSFCRWLIVSVSLFFLAVFAWPIEAQSLRAGQSAPPIRVGGEGQSLPTDLSAPVVRVGGVKIAGVPDDWTRHRVVFSDPGTEQDAIKNGRYERWQKIVNDPRYVMQQLRRNLPIEGPAAAVVNARRAWLAEARSADRKLHPILPRQIPRRPILPGRERFSPRPLIEQDWNELLANTVYAASVSTFPAKWSFDTTAARCADDFVVYPVPQYGGTTIIAYYNLYAGCSGSGPVPSVDWAYNSGGVSFLSPSSPIFALSGQEVAFTSITLDADAGGAEQSVLALLKFAAPAGDGANGTLTAPDTPQFYAPNDFWNNGSGCTAPCTTYTQFNSGDAAPAPVYGSSNPYYDYGTDSLYVGDNVGQLHKFHPVFNGPLTEVVGSGTNWPVQLANTNGNDTNEVSSPVYDPVSGYVLVGTTTTPGNTPGGFLYAVDATLGAIHAYSPQLDNQFGVYDSPLLDPAIEEAYVFVGSDPTTGHSLVYQFSPSFTTWTPASVDVGPGDGGSRAAYQLAGTFDNAYYTSSNGTGNIYMCSSSVPATLYQLPISGGLMKPPNAGPVIGDDTGLADGGYCSEVTEFYNSSLDLGNGEDLLFLSVWAGTESGCTDDATDGCVMSFNVTPASLPADLTTLAPLGTLDVYTDLYSQSTSGIIIDNAATNLAGDSQIYFETRAPDAPACTPGSSNAGDCAVQASQQNLSQ